MKTVAGIFNNRAAAERTLTRLHDRGVRLENLSMLSPGDSPESVERRTPTDEMEQPGIGRALGGVVGGALGVAGGVQLGAAAASMFVPGVGPVMAMGIAGAALLGAGGVAGGAAAGQAIENSLSRGLPKDELYLYEDALRKGRSVLIAFANDSDEAESFRKIMRNEGAESIDAAQHDWWMGLRDAEREHYTAGGYDFKRDEQDYKLGFAAALHKDRRGVAYTQCVDDLRRECPECFENEAFRRGYERGQRHYAELTNQS